MFANARAGAVRMMCAIALLLSGHTYVQARGLDLIVVAKQSVVVDGSAGRFVRLLDEGVADLRIPGVRSATLVYSANGLALLPLRDAGGQAPLARAAAELESLVPQGPAATLTDALSRALDLLDSDPAAPRFMLVVTDEGSQARAELEASAPLKERVLDAFRNRGGGSIAMISGLGEGAAASPLDIAKSPAGLRRVRIVDAGGAREFATVLRQFFVSLAAESDPPPGAADSPAHDVPAAQMPAPELPAADAPAAQTPEAEPLEDDAPAAQMPAPELPAADPPAAQTPEVEPLEDDVPAAQMPALELPAADPSAARPAAPASTKRPSPSRKSSSRSPVRRPKPARPSQNAPVPAPSAPATSHSQLPASASPAPASPSALMPPPAATPAPAAPAPAAPTRANLAFNAPESMRLHEIRGIHLVLSDSETQAALKARIDQPGARMAASVRTATMMRARVQGGAFKINPLTSELQPYEPGEVTEWRWEVEAVTPGSQRLYVTVESVAQSDGKTVYRTVDSHSQTIEVQVAAPWYGPWLQPLMLVLALPLAAAVLAWLWRLRRRALRRARRAAGGEVQSGSSVFISYSRRDTTAVNRLVDALEARSIHVWMDRTGIETATQWSEQIVNGLEASYALLLVGSESAFESENVAREVQLAMEMNKPIVPAMLDDAVVPKRLQYPLAGVQRFELGKDPDDTLFDSLAASLTRLREPLVANGDAASAAADANA